MDFKIGVLKSMVSTNRGLKIDDLKIEALKSLIFKNRLLKIDGFLKSMS